jgi:hypothetical protein
VNGHVPQPDLRGICPWAAGGGAPSAVQTHVRYQTHDLTALLQSGPNAIGLLSGHVMIVANHTGADVDRTKDNRTATPLVMALFMAELSVSGSNATEQLFLATTGSEAGGWLQRSRSFVTTDSAWATAIDWTQEEPGWATSNFHAAPPAWRPATFAAGSPSHAMRALGMPLSRVLAEHRPLSVRPLHAAERMIISSPSHDRAGTSEAPRHWLYAFDRQLVGTIRVAALPHAQHGSQLSIRLGEWLDDDDDDDGDDDGDIGAGAAGDDDEGRRDELRSRGRRWNAGGGAAAAAGCAAKPCPHHPGRTYCPNVPSPGQCDQPRHLPCPPCQNNHSHHHRERLGNLSVPAIAGDQVQWENHTLRGNMTQDLETVFCWHGFQYILVSDFGGGTGFNGSLDAVIALEIRTNVSSTGSLRFSGDGVGSQSTQAAIVLNGVNTMLRNSHTANVAAYMPYYNFALLSCHETNEILRPRLTESYCLQLHASSRLVA